MRPELRFEPHHCGRAELGFQGRLPRLGALLRISRMNARNARAYVGGICPLQRVVHWPSLFPREEHPRLKIAVKEAGRRRVDFGQ